MKLFKFVFCILFGLSTTMAVFAQTPPAVPAGANPFGMSAGLGTEVVDGKVYQTLSLIPDVGLPPVGVGLDITLHFQFYRENDPDKTFGFYPRQEDWYDPTKTLAQNLDMYLSRIVYLRYGQKGENLYAKVGLIQDGTLGNGFILGNYDNSILRPEKKYVGLAFDLDSNLFGIPYVGVETFIGNLTALDVLGGRLFVRPLAGTDLGVLKGLQVGGTYVVDNNAYYNANPLKTTNYLKSPQAVRVYGADLRLPILSGDLIGLATYGDFATENNAIGSMVGFGGSLVKVITFSAQARFLGQNFIPVYFDKGYDLNRTAKYQTYTGTVTTPAFNGWFASVGSAMSGVYVFNTSLEGPIGSVANAVADDPNVYPKLRSVFRIEDGVLPVGLQAYYNKDLIKDFWSLIDPTNAQIGARVSYKAGPAVIALNYQLRYIPKDQQAPGTSAWEVTSKLETAVKLF